MRSSCACLLIVFEPATVQPGNHIEVPLRYVPDKRKGETAKTVFIDSNDPDQPRLRFTVKGYILEAQSGEVSVHPNPCYLEATAGQTTEQEFVLRNEGLGALSVKGIRGIGCEVDPPKTASLAPGDSTAFRARLAPGQHWGFNYFVLVESDDPTEPLLIVPVHLFLQEEISLEATLAKVGSSLRDIVRAVFFASLDCPHCLAVKSFYLPRLQNFFQGQFIFETAYVDREDNYAWLVDVEEKLGRTGNDLPVLVMGPEILGGDDAIIEHTPGKLEALFSSHGCEIPDRPSVTEGAPVPARRDTIYLAYFRKPGCKECDRAAFMLKRLARRFAPIVIRTFDVTEPEAQELNEALCCIYGAPEKKHLVAPSLFSGGQYLIEHDLDDASAQDMLARLSPRGSEPPWEEAAGSREQARQSIIARFQSLGPLTVVLGGLVDGINPCAFATIIFFVSYLAFVGRAGREILWIGLSFTLAVFLTYFLVGLGALAFLQSLSVFHLLARIVYGVTAILAIALGVLSVLDFRKLRQGRTKEISLQLPDFLKRRIHKTIRERTRTRNYVVAAFVTGAIVSFLELACTGQVYLPTICFVTGIPELRMHAIAYLVLYNVMFVVPLIAVFLVSYYGTTSGQLAGLFQSRAALVKLCAAVLFFALAGIMISVLV